MTAAARHELPGLQSERTSLAWDRTALGLLANGALLLQDVTPDRPTPLVAAAGALLLALICAGTGRRRARRIRSQHSGRTPAATREIMLIGGGVIALGLLIAVTTVS